MALQLQLISSWPPGAHKPAFDELGCAVLECSAIVVANYTRHFFDEKVPSCVSTSSTSRDMKTVAFVGYVALNIEICISSYQDVAIVIFKESKQNDVILLQQLFGQFVSFLRSSGLQATTMHQTLMNAGVVEDEFDLESDIDDAMRDALWSERVDLVKGDLESHNGAMREEAFQHLARWAASEPKSHRAVAKCLQASKVVITLFVNPSATLAEMFPAASALKNVTQHASPALYMDLCASPLFDVLQNIRTAELPPLVVRELEVAVDAIQLWGAYEKWLSRKAKKKSSKIVAERMSEFSSDSTRCTDLDPILEIEDDFLHHDDEHAGEIPYQQEVSRSKQLLMLSSLETVTSALTHEEGTSTCAANWIALANANLDANCQKGQVQALVKVSECSAPMQALSE
jgi:hypothetical protein